MSEIRNFFKYSYHELMFPHERKALRLTLGASALFLTVNTTLNVWTIEPANEIEYDTSLTSETIFNIHKVLSDDYTRDIRCVTDESKSYRQEWGDLLFGTITEPFGPIYLTGSDCQIVADIDPIVIDQKGGLSYEEISSLLTLGELQSTHYQKADTGVNEAICESLDTLEIQLDYYGYTSPDNVISSASKAHWDNQDSDYPSACRLINSD